MGNTNMTGNAENSGWAYSNNWAQKGSYPGGTTWYKDNRETCGAYQIF